MNEIQKRRLTIGIFAGAAALVFGLSAVFSCLYVGQSRKLNNVQSDLGQVSSEKAELEENYEALNQAHEELNSACEELNLTCEELNTEIENLNETVRQLENEIAADKEMIEKKREQAESLKNMIRSLRDENNDADDQIAALQLQLDELNDGMSSLEASVESLERQAALKTKSLERLRERNHSLSDTVSELTDTLEAAHGELEELRNTPPTIVYVPVEPEPEPEPQPIASEPITSEPITQLQEPEPQTQAPPSYAAETAESQPLYEPVSTAVPGSAEAQLIALMQGGAPLKWAWDSSDELVRVYPKLAYMYVDLSTGAEVSYNADTVLYSASLIKAPYIYTVLREIEAFEAGYHPRDEYGRIIYGPGEEKYDLSEVWTYDPDTMWEDGSGEIMEMDAGFQLTWRELFEYALLYSDNIAFAQLRQRFGYSSFYQAVAELGIVGTNYDFMDLTARDCAKFLRDMYSFFQTGGELAAMMKADMSRSKHPEMITCYYPAGMASHKYGWDIDAFHDMALIFDERPYLIVLMTDYDDGGDEPLGFFGDVVALTKRIHAGE